MEDFTLENGCTVEHTVEDNLSGQVVRVTVWSPDHKLSCTAVRSPEYISSEHYHVGIAEQAQGLVLHGTDK